MGSPPPTHTTLDCALKSFLAKIEILFQKNFETRQNSSKLVKTRRNSSKLVELVKTRRTLSASFDVVRCGGGPLIVIVMNIHAKNQENP